MGSVPDAGQTAQSAAQGGAHEFNPFSSANTIMGPYGLETAMNPMAGMNPMISGAHAQGGQIDMGPQAQGRAGEQGLIGQLQQQAAGQGPSLAAQQLQSAANQNQMRQAGAIQQALGGGGSAGSGRMALLNQGAQIQGQTAADAAQARIQEQMGARQQLGQVLGQQRGADIGLAGQQAGLNQQANLANAGFNQQANMANQSQYQFLQNLMAQQQQQQNQLAYGAQGAANQANNLTAGQIVGGIGSAAGGLMAMSDRDSKKELYSGNQQIRDFLDYLHAYREFYASPDEADGPGDNRDIAMENPASLSDKNAKTKPKDGEDQIRDFLDYISAYRDFYKNPDEADGPGDNRQLAMTNDAVSMSDERMKQDKGPGEGQLHSFLDQLKAYSYKYKDPGRPGAGAGEHFSVMAQDAEKTPVGRSMVKQAPDGTKIMDYGKGFGVMLAAQADLHQRLKALEGDPDDPEMDEED